MTSLHQEHGQSTQLSLYIIFHTALQTLKQAYITFIALHIDFKVNQIKYLGFLSFVYLYINL